jgi:hypothetical protein
LKLTLKITTKVKPSCVRWARHVVLFSLSM